jgi:hypothetical protein
LIAKSFAAKLTSLQYVPRLYESLNPVLTLSTEGKGVNTIFRPTNGFKMDNRKAKDNLLEINLTLERLQFMQASVLKQVPNRGFDNQPTVYLTGVPYQQTVYDRLDEGTGKPNLSNPVGIHFEQGLFMLTPATVSPKNPPTISRMASIPHGTAFTAQDLEPQTMKEGQPVIPDINIVPFPLNANPVVGTVKGGQDNMQKDVVESDIRKPGDLKCFIRNGVLSIDGINNPNQFLNEINDNKDFVGHWTFTVRSKHPKIGGGGVSNIAFLVDGAKPTFKDSVSGNAAATEVICQYWVSVVRHQVDIPAGDYTDPSAVVKATPNDDMDDVPGPRFWIQVGRKLTEKKTIELTSTQIQYSQNVRLDFGTLSWPHISVATLAPALPIYIRSDHSALESL